MSTEENKALAQRFYDAVNEGDFSGFVKEVLAPDFRLHFNSVPDMDHDVAVVFLGGLVGAIPGIQFDVEDQVAEGDRVVSRVVFRGTHAGDFMGIPPTGKNLTVKAIHIHRIVDGKIVEQWVVSDRVGMMQQMGVIPTPDA